MSISIFLPIAFNYSAAPAAGSGVVNRTTYTVPAGKRAILEHCFLLIDTNAAAVNTMFCLFTVTLGATVIRVIQLAGSGIPGPVFTQCSPNIDLNSGDVVNGVTINLGAVAPAMFLHSVVKEYR